MHPTAEWLTQWNQCRSTLRCPLDLNAYFSAPTIAGMHLAVLDIGPCSLPSGRVLARDPLSYLESRSELPYFQTVPSGTYRTELAVVLPGRTGDCSRYAAARLCFSEQPAAYFEAALTGNEPLDGPVDSNPPSLRVATGLACLCDEDTHAAYCSFVEHWRDANPGGNLYEDYFAPLFTASHYRQPTHQRRGGDWINFQIPGTDLHMPIFQSGFGDGCYPVYFGYDAADTLCQLVVLLIDIHTSFDRPSRYLSAGAFTPVAGGLRGQISLPRWEPHFCSPGPYPLFLSGGSAVGLTPAQQNGYDFLLLNQAEIYHAILTALFDLYPDTYRDPSDCSDQQNHVRMPGASGAAQMARQLTPLEIILHPVESGGLPYIGYRFSCPWNGQKGFGALLYGCRVVEAGDAAVATSIHTASRDLIVARTRIRKEELMKILRASSWEEHHGNIYLTASYRGQDLLFYFSAFDEAQLLLFEQEKLKRLMSRLEDLNRQAHEILLRTRPSRAEADFPLHQVSLSTDGSFRLGFEDLHPTDGEDVLLWVEFSWDFCPTGAVVYDSY